MSYLRTLEAAFGFAPTTANYFPTFRGIDHPFLDFLNVRVVTSVEEFPPPRTLERIDGGRFGHYRLYRNPDPLPRWFLPSAAETIREEELRRWLLLKDPRRVAVFDGRAASWVGERGEVRLVVLTPGRITLDVPGSGDRLLATSPDAGGLECRAVGDGGGERRLRRRPPSTGTSRVELRFVPPGLVAGFWIGGLSFIAAALPAARRRAA